MIDRHCAWHRYCVSERRSAIVLFVLSSACGPKDLGEAVDEAGDEATESESESSGPDTGSTDVSSLDSASDSETAAETGPGLPPPSGPPIPIDPDAPPIFYAVGDEIWRIAADGSGAGPIGLTIDEGGFGALYYGTDEATVSRDGTRIGYVEQDAVMVAEIGGDVVETQVVFELPAGTWTHVGISTWSPDGSTLLAFALEDEPIDRVDPPPPLPEGFELGTYVIDAETMTASHTTQVWGWLAWAGDADVLLDAGDSTLLRYSLSGGDPTLVRETDGAYGFMQLHVAGERMVWTYAGPDADQSQVLLASLLGGEALPMSPTLGWADIVFPKLAPTADRVFHYVNEEATISEGADQVAQTIPLPFPARARWAGDQHLLSVTDTGLIRVDIHGNVTVLDAAATRLLAQ